MALTTAIKLYINEEVGFLVFEEPTPELYFVNFHGDVTQIDKDDTSQRLIDDMKEFVEIYESSFKLPDVTGII